MNAGKPISKQLNTAGDMEYFLSPPRVEGLDALFTERQRTSEKEGKFNVLTHLCSLGVPERKKHLPDEQHCKRLYISSAGSR
jgi:hypothetical protein